MDKKEKKPTKSKNQKKPKLPMPIEPEDRQEFERMHVRLKKETADWIKSFGQELTLRDHGTNSIVIEKVVKYYRENHPVE